MTLFDYHLKHSWVQITQFQGSDEIIERLKEMGFMLNQKVQWLGQAPFNGPRMYRVGNIVMALRHEEAKCIKVNPL